MLNILYLVGGLVVIILGANGLVSGASSLAKRLKIPDLVIGLTIVSIGTSAPELAISVISAISGNTDIAVGNIVGSNIVNILFILGVSAIIYPLTVQKNTQYKEIPLAVLAIVLVAIMGNDVFFDKAPQNMLTRIDGLVLLSFFIIFMYYTFQITTQDDAPAESIEQQPLWKSVLYVIIGVAGLFLGGKYFVEGAVAVARILGMSDAVIGLTIVAVGTSLPELATSVVAAFQKKSDIAIGNVVGSNIINVFLILGITATIRPLPLHPLANIDLMVAILAALFLFLATFVVGKREIKRVEGIFFVACYVFYLAFLIISN